jgi:3-methyladenine DNA glycosylase AlkD
MTRRALGISVPRLRHLARQIAKEDRLALALWRSGTHQARILAASVDDPGRMSLTQMDRWACNFNSWDVCNPCCGNLFN